MQDLSNETMIHIKKEGVEYLQFRKLLEYEDCLTHCYTLKQNGLDFNVIKDNAVQEEKKEKSYQKIATALGFKRGQMIRPNQTHSDHIEIISDGKEILNEVDGLLTEKEEIATVLSFADCTPILLFDPVKKIIGNIHSGWKGTLYRIGSKAVKKMVEEYHCNPKDIIACIGPCISKCHFEVQEDVKLLFETEFKEMKLIIQEGEIKERSKRYYIDTTQINCLALQEVGLTAQNIITSGICTVCHQDQMHSYRSEHEKAGRNISVMLLKKGEKDDTK